jgi:methionine-gamma-lyase
MELKDRGFNTRLIHGGHLEDAYGAATVPIYQTSTFAFHDADDGARRFSGENKGYIYTRIGNPTIAALEHAVALLEKGHGAIGVSSGMAAANVIYQTFLAQGDHMVSTDAVYGPSRSIMENHYPKYGVQSTYLNTSDPKRVDEAMKPNTRLLYIETPANPTMDITDISAMADIAHRHGALLIVDNTFCSPYLQSPLDLGADIVFHSMTKFINGHADVVAGIIIAKNAELHKKMQGMMINLGCNMDPHQAFLVLRGLKTLSLRIDRAQQSALKIADFLERHPKVAWVRYPGLPSHPHHDTAKKQMRGGGTMISFGLKGGFGAAKILMNNVRLALLAVSLGGVETLIQHPASMTHSKVSAEGKAKAGITDDLIRLAVGIEDVEDLIMDLEQGINKV